MLILNIKLTVHRLHDKILHSTRFEGAEERLKIPAGVKGSSETPSIKAAIAPVSMCTAATTMKTALLLVFLAVGALANPGPVPSEETKVIGKPCFSALNTIPYYTVSFYRFLTLDLKITTAFYVVWQLTLILLMWRIG
jgi:hypothetical protein